MTRRGGLCQREISAGYPCNPSVANFGYPSQPCDGANDGVAGQSWCKVNAGRFHLLRGPF